FPQLASRPVRLGQPRGGRAGRPVCAAGGIGGDYGCQIFLTLGCAFATVFHNPKTKIKLEEGHNVERTAAAEMLADDVKSEKLPYPPSWVDQVDSWVSRLPLPAWLFYLAIGVALTLSY